jgi:hypothetical protein
MLSKTLNLVKNIYIPFPKIFIRVRARKSFTHPQLHVPLIRHSGKFLLPFGDNSCSPNISKIQEPLEGIYYTS